LVFSLIGLISPGRNGVPATTPQRWAIGTQFCGQLLTSRARHSSPTLRAKADIAA
jgi:hypothetical protein